MRLDQQYPRDWRNYLEILSVKSTEAFLSELAMPIQQQSFPQVLRLARACLEVYMGRLADKQVDSTYTWEFPKYWQSYRNNEPVLNDTSFLQYVERFKAVNGDETICGVYMELKGWVGDDTACALESWFENNYQPIRSGFQIWLHEFWHLLRIRAQHKLDTNLLNDEQWQLVQKFCDDFYSKQTRIRNRFSQMRENQDVKAPTLWESILQTFPVDSYAGDHYPWLNNIRECLIFQAFRSEWLNLTNRLGPSLMNDFTKWVQQEANSRLNEEYITDDLTKFT